MSNLKDLKPAAENSLCQLSSLSKSSDVSVLLVASPGDFFRRTSVKFVVS